MSQARPPGVEGLLVIDKPGGPTSHDIVARVRSTLKTKRVGHAGTLDPMASGLLPLVLGRATRLVRYLPHSPKTYLGTLKLGIRTSTDDVTGETLSVSDSPLPLPDAVFQAASTLVGSIQQVPPAVSARRVGGQRMYKLARQGVKVDAPAVTVDVSRFTLQETESPEIYSFAADVSVGTYIRSLARDLGELLGCGGTLASLRRTAIGPLSVENAVSVPAERRPERDELLARLIPLEDIPLSPPTVRLEFDADAADFLLGRAVRVDNCPSGTCSVLTASGRLIGIAEAGGSQLQPRVVLG